MRAVSKRQARKQRSRKPPWERQLRLYPLCEVRRLRPHDCFGGLTVHEPWTRARGGPIDDPRNMVTVCAEANRLISQDADWIRWATDVGVLIHASQGSAWLEAGGVVRRGRR